MADASGTCLSGLLLWATKLVLPESQANSELPEYSRVATESTPELTAFGLPVQQKYVGDFRDDA